MRRIRSALLVICLAGLCGGFAAGEEATSAEGHEAGVLEWRRARLESLTRDDGWLTLTGLYWLEDGDSTCGSDPRSDVVLPESAPARVGTMTIAGERREFQAEPGVAVKIDSQRRRHAALRTDADGEPTLIEIGSVGFYLIDRDGRVGVRIKDREHAARESFDGIGYYPIDGRWRVEARFEPYDPPKTIPVPTVLGTTSDSRSPGAVVFRMAARDLRLDALPADEGELWLIFGDATNGEETYGGGRFLYARGPDADGRVVIDFNKSFNPPCAFTPYATCPLPPPQNKLELAVRAGEKSFGDNHHP